MPPGSPGGPLSPYQHANIYTCITTSNILVHVLTELLSQHDVYGFGLMYNMHFNGDGDKSLQQTMRYRVRTENNMGWKGTKAHATRLNNN